MKRVFPLIGLVLGLGVLLALLLDARARAGCTACLPSLDMSDYLSRALRIEGAALREGLGAGVREAIRADVHPPLHPLLLALWFGAGAQGIAGACTLITLEMALGLGALVALGRSLDPRRGVWAGLLAAGMTMLSGEHQRLATVTMTEALALLATLVALLALVRHAQAGGRGAALLAGAAIALAGLVRYNLAPMLLVPALLAWTLERIRRPRELASIEPLLLVGPVAALVAVWWALEPKLPVALAKFFTNVDSGLPFWSAENLLWAPRSFAAFYTLRAPLAVAWGLAALVGLGLAWRPRWRTEAAGTRLVQLFVLVGLVAVTVHPYKLARTLHGLVPLVYLIGALPLCAVPLPRSRLAGAALLGALAVALGLGVRDQRRLLDDPDTLGRLECMDAGDPIEALDKLVKDARGRQIIAVSGGAAVLSGHAVELWLRLDDPRREVTQDPPLLPDCTASEAWPPDERCVSAYAAALLRSPEMAAGRALVVTIEKFDRPPPKVSRQDGANRRKLRAERGQVHWSQQNATTVARLAEEAGVPLVDTVRIHGGLAELRLYGVPRAE